MDSKWEEKRKRREPVKESWRLNETPPSKKTTTKFLQAFGEEQRTPEPFLELEAHEPTLDKARARLKAAENRNEAADSRLPEELASRVEQEPSLQAIRGRVSLLEAQRRKQGSEPRQAVTDQTRIRALEMELEEVRKALESSQSSDEVIEEGHLSGSNGGLSKLIPCCRSSANSRQTNDRVIRIGVLQ